MVNAISSVHLSSCVDEIRLQSFRQKVACEIRLRSVDGFKDEKGYKKGYEDGKGFIYDFEWLELLVNEYGFYVVEECGYLRTVA